MQKILVTTMASYVQSKQECMEGRLDGLFEGFGQGQLVVRCVVGFDVGLVRRECISRLQCWVLWLARSSLSRRCRLSHRRSLK